MFANSPKRGLSCLFGGGGNVRLWSGLGCNRMPMIERLLRHRLYSFSPLANTDSNSNNNHHHYLAELYFAGPLLAAAVAAAASAIATADPTSWPISSNCKWKNSRRAAHLNFKLLLCCATRGPKEAQVNERATLQAAALAAAG